MSENGPVSVPYAPLVLRPEEVARALQVSRWTVYELLRTRALHSVKIGGVRRVPVDALAQYIADLVEDNA